MTPVREQAHLLGPRRALVGVVAEPPQDAGGDRPAIVLLNSGIIHRVGTNRMTVPLARALAAAGHTVVRFDLSGIGDSPPRTDSLSPLDAALADIREVLDALERTRGVRQFVLAGLCSGADHSIIYAPSDARVVGAILLDPSVPSTRLARIHHYRKRLLRGQSWLNLLRGKNPLWLALRGREEPPADPVEAELRKPEVRAFLGRAYAAAVARGVRLLAIGTGDRGTYRNQLVDAFPGIAFADRLQLEYFGDSDHMFTLEVHRARVIELVVGWAARTRFGAAQPGPAAAASGGDR